MVVRALPAMAISRLLSDRGESVSTFVMTGLPMSLLGLSLLFSFQSLQAPRLSAEPYRRSTSSGRQKTHSVSGLRASSQSVGMLPYRAASVVKSLPVISGDYTTSVRGVNPKLRILCCPLLFFTLTYL